MSWSAAPAAAMLSVPSRRWRNDTAGPQTPARVSGGAGVVRATVARTQRCGRRSPSGRITRGRPGPGGAHHGARAHRARLRPHSAHPAALGLDALDRAARVEARAVLDGRVRERLGRFDRLRVAVARRVETAEPGPCHPGQEAPDLARAHEARVHAKFARRAEPLLEESDALLGRGEREVAALDPLDVSPELLLETAPDAIGLHHQRDLGRVSSLLPDEPPVAARLLPRDLVPLHQHDTHAAAGKVVGRRAADDASADYDDVRLALHVVTQGSRPCSPPRSPRS